MVTVLKMLTRTRKIVTSKAILPGMTSGGTTKLIHETTTNRPEQQRELNAENLPTNSYPHLKEGSM